MQATPYNPRPRAITAGSPGGRCCCGKFGRPCAIAACSATAARKTSSISVAKTKCRRACVAMGTRPPMLSSAPAMRYRRCARLDWEVARIGYGMWGMGGWTGSDDTESARSLDRAVALGCNFFDTALAYGTARANGCLARCSRVTSRYGSTSRRKYRPSTGNGPVAQPRRSIRSFHTTT